MRWNGWLMLLVLSAIDFLFSWAILGLSPLAALLFAPIVGAAGVLRYR
jgi:hypothetical protein